MGDFNVFTFKMLLLVSIATFLLNNIPFLRPHGKLIISLYLNMENISYFPFTVNIIVISLFPYRLDELNVFKIYISMIRNSKFQTFTMGY